MQKGTAYYGAVSFDLLCQLQNLEKWCILKEYITAQIVYEW